MNESATARIEGFAGKGWGNIGLNRLAQDLIAEIAAYPATVPDGIAFDDPYVIDGDPYDVPMEVGPVEIRDADSVVFTEPAAEFPAAWDATARQIVAQKYFYGDHSQGFRETSALQVVFRVSARIALWAIRKRTFSTAEDACRFFIYLSHIQIQQEFAFNSPVYFNVGVDVYGAIQNRENFYFDESDGRVRPCSDSSDPHPMISACYIQSVDDRMSSIMALATSEAMLFKRGSGTGTDLSPLRSTREKLTGGGRPSGPISFMKMYDSIAGIIKSGGRVRRAAKMQTLKYTHPDIMEFVTCKRDEERKARALIAAGYEANFNGEAYSTVAFQNANLSVRVDSDLFRTAEAGESFDTIAVTTGAVVDSIDASTFLRTVAECAWDCGDPALQFQDRIDEFHTVPNHGPNTSTNPCSEYVHIDDSSCNLGSLNVMKFMVPGESIHGEYYRTDQARRPRFDVAHFRRVSTVAAVAMETLVGAGSYPTEAIALNSHRFRPLGQGYANVGCYVMVAGFPYDSPESRAIVAAITAILTATVYATSALLARRFGPFDGFAADWDNMRAVMEKHRGHAYRIDDSTPNDCSPAVAADPGLFQAARESWDEALDLGRRYGYRNSQATCIAPTGCVAPETMVLTGAGLLPIASLGDPDGAEWQGVDFRVAQESRSAMATRFFVNGLKEVHRIETKAGHVLRATPNHRVRVIDEDGYYSWRRMDAVKAGDYVVMAIGGHAAIMGNSAPPRFVPVDGGTRPPSVIDDAFAELLGFFVGNGYTKKTGGLHLIINDEDHDLDVKFDALMYGMGFVRTTEYKTGCHVANYNGREWAPWFVANGLDKSAGNRGEGAASATIPAVVLRSPTNILKSFLRGLFAADGTIGEVGRGTPVVEYSTVSETMSIQVQAALESIGIRARRSINVDRGSSYGKRPLFRVRLASVADCEAFSECVGFSQDRKQSRLLAALASTEDTRARIGDRIAHRHLIGDFYATAEGLGNAIRQDIAARRNVGAFNTAWASRLIHANPSLADSRIGRLLTIGNVQFVEVKSASPDGLSPTFDLSVPERNTYIANGFVSHNTIAFMMGCDTLGIEPEIALVRFKALAGRGTLKLVNRSVRLALENLGYPGGLIDSILNHVSRYNTIEDVVSNGGHAVSPSGLRSEHLPIFDCAFPPSPVTVDGYEWRPAWGRSIGIDGHVDMMAAATSLVSGAVSKTVNMSVSSTVDDILRVYGDAWRKGCKAIAVYRDGSKGSQPVTTSEVGEMKGEADSRAQADEKAIRRFKKVIAELEHERELDQSVISDAREQIRIMASVLGEREAELRAIRRHDGPQPFPDGPRQQADEKAIRRLKETNEKLERENAMIRGWDDGASETAIRELDGLRALKATMQAANVRMHDELAAKNHEAANLRRMLGSAATEPRFRMPVDRDAKIHKFNVSGHEGFLIRGMTESGQLGEVFIEMSKQGSTVAGLMDCVGILISLALQHRVPVAKVVEKMEFQKFNPAGITTNRDIKFCSSIIDYVGRFLGIHHVPGYRERMRPVRSDGATPAEPMGVGAVDDVPAPDSVATGRDGPDRSLRDMIADVEVEMYDNPPPGDGLKALVAEDINNDPCPSCGAIMVRVQPNCMVCYGCGYVDGGCGG